MIQVLLEAEMFNHLEKSGFNARCREYQDLVLADVKRDLNDDELAVFNDWWSGVSVTNDPRVTPKVYGSIHEAISRGLG